jgi:peptidoglycan/LPS O-acetylase OafA/YrhL
MKSGDYASLPAAEEETAAGAAPFPPIAAGKASTLQHLNGLRALAFLGVLLFHFRLGCSGGFLGVDVFFVLSGFLMTRSLQSQIERESFTFRSFFIRRLWRLYPALLATIITVLVLTYLIFSLGHTEAVARSALASAGGVSNVLFMLQDDYFGSSAAYKPLLHTWSLSVEWQFYAVWPLLLIGCATFRSSAGDTTALRAMLAVLSSASLGYACLVPNGQYAFFSLPSRIFEFCCGAVLASSPPGAPGAPGALAASPFLSNAVGAVGTAIICASFSVVTSSQPGLVSLLPVLGSMMVIATPSDAIANQLFTLPPVEYIGRVSYSAYLVHWPLYVFYTTLFGDGTHPLEDKLVLLSATGALSILLYHAVEDKFRFAKERWQSTVGCSMLAACVAISASALLTGGWRWRAIDAGGSARSAEFYQQQYMRLVALTPADQRVGATNNLVPKERDVQLSPVTAFVIGDSHAEHLLGALDPISRETNMTFFMRTHHGSSTHRPASPARPLARVWPVRRADRSCPVVPGVMRQDADRTSARTAKMTRCWTGERTLRSRRARGR